MSNWLSALIGASVASLGLITGWFVLGTQRVTEELTKERRDVYGTLLRAILDRASGRGDTAADGGERRLSVEELAVKAQFIASPELYASQLLLSSGSIADSLHSDDDDATDQLSRLVTAMRLETQRNSSRSRRSPAWAHLYDQRTMPVRVSPAKLEAGVQAQRARAISTRVLTKSPRYQRRVERWHWY